MNLTEASEHYRKWLVDIQYNSKIYLTVWGMDIAEGEDQDKVLVDADNRFLLFESTDGVMQFCRANKLFDTENFEQWMTYVKGDEEIPDYIEFDSFRNQQYFNDSSITFDLLTALNFVSDYAYQVNDEALIALRKNELIQDYWEKIYDTYVWDTGSKPAQTEKFLPGLTVAMNELFDYLEKVIRIM